MDQEHSLMDSPIPRFEENAFLTSTPWHYTPYMQYLSFIMPITQQEIARDTDIHF